MSTAAASSRGTIGRVRAVLFDWGGTRTVLLTGRPTPPHDVVPDASVPELRDVLAVIDAWR